MAPRHNPTTPQAPEGDVRPLPQGLSRPSAWSCVSVLWTATTAAHAYCSLRCGGRLCLPGPAARATSPIGHLWCGTCECRRPAAAMYACVQVQCENGLLQAWRDCQPDAGSLFTVAGKRGSGACAASDDCVSGVCLGGNSAAKPNCVTCSSSGACAACAAGYALASGSCVAAPSPAATPTRTAQPVSSTAGSVATCPVAHLEGTCRQHPSPGRLRSLPLRPVRSGGRLPRPAAQPA